MSNHRKVLKTTPFWLVPKQLNPTHQDYRPASPDLDLLPGEWVYNIVAYEESVAEMKRTQKNIAKLDTNISPKQKL